MPLEDVQEMEVQLREKSVNPRDVKMKLALEITQLFWGAGKAQEAEKHFITQFQKKEIPNDAAVIQTTQGEELIELLVRSKLAASNTAARRLLRQGAVVFDEEKITDPRATIEKSGVLRVGKKQMARVEVE